MIRSQAFIRAARRLIKKSPSSADGLRATLGQLADDAHHPSLRTHKLKGDLDGLWACSAVYDLRVVFSIASQDDGEAILLLTVGTHDEVY